MRATFFALAALPFCAIAQDPVPEAAPATTTTTSEAFIPPVIDTSTDIPVGVNPISTDAIVILQSTSEAIQENPEPTTQPAPVVQDTTTSQDIVQAPTSKEPPPVQDTTTGPGPVIDNTQPIAQEGTTQPNVQDTTTGQPIVEDTTSQQIPPVQDTTTELPLPVDPTTTWLPVVDTTNQPIIQTPGSSQEPVGQDTTTDVQLPVVPTTTSNAVPGVATETNNPLPDTTTQQQPVIESTTAGVPPAETTTAQVPVQDTTTTAAEQPAQTTTQDQEPEPTTEESKPTSKDDSEPVITRPPAQTTVAPEVATSSVSSISSQVAALIPIINKWTEDPESLTDETNKEVEDTHDDIIAVIVSLGGKPDVGCNKKRGLLGPIGDIINKLACMAQDLTNISGGIIAGNVPAVTSVVPQVQSQNDDLTEEDEENQSQEEQSKEESTKQEETTKKESTTEAPTTTEVPTSTEESTTTEATTTTTGLPQPCGADTCGGGSGGDSCPIGSGGSKGGQMGSVAGDINCNDLSTTTIDGPLPTDPSKPIDFGDDPFTAPTARSESASPPSKRDIELVARAFNDDMSPNPFYVASLNPHWVDQTGATAGHWFGAPPFAGKGSAGVNGIYGCTSVIVVSDLGAYISHIWENPVFIDSNWNPTPDNEFQATTFNALRDGTPNGNAESIAGYVGTDQVPGVLHSMFHPRVFVVTPFTNDFERSLGVTTTFRYEDRANYLATAVSGIIPGSDSTVLGYTRTGRTESTEQYGTWGRAIVEYDMLEEIVFGSDDDMTGQFMGRWRLWVEDQLVTSHKFLVFPDPIDLPETTPAAGLQKRAKDEAASQCLVRGGSTGATSAGPSSTDNAATTADATSTTETSAAPTTDEKTAEATGITTAEEKTTEAAGTTISEDKTAEATTTQSDAVLSTSTPSTFITTTRASSNGITSGVTTDAATTSEEVRTYYPCVIFGGPRVNKPYCQCSTTVSGKQYVTSASLIDNSCEDYTSYPSPVVPVTEAPATQAPVQTPFTETNDGTVLVYSAYTLEYFMAYTIHVTATRGYGVPSTVSTPLPTQTAVDNDGSGQCGTADSLSKKGLGEACDRAINEFDADTVYKGYTTRYSRSNKGILMAASFGQAACIAKFECDDYGIGMKGSDIIAARENAKENDGIWICGHIRLSNSCSVVMDYCTNCNNSG
ncbi:hypothetical protein LZL87_007945 [Fusarium oxysporum]|nr:hypothetical protein LZL87_007945 [Fusarium oxysporum]